MNNKKLNLGILILVSVFLALSAYQIYYVAHLSTTLNLDYGAEVSFEDIKDRLEIEMDQLWLVDIAQVIFGSLVVLALYMRSRFIELEVNLYKSFENTSNDLVTKVPKVKVVEKVCRIQELDKNIKILSTLKSDFAAIVNHICMISKASSGIIYDLKGDELTPVSTFATVKKYSFYSSYRLGVGLVGEVGKSLQPIIINDVDTTEMMISSGLGKALPNQLIILPLLFSGKVVGVLELSYLERLTSEEENQLKQLCTID